MSRNWELINPTTWKLERGEYTAVIVHDTSTNVYKPCIRRLVAREYTTVETLEKTGHLGTAMWRCKHWLARKTKASKKQ